MKATNGCSFLLVFACLFLLTSALAAGEDADLIEVTAVGIGKDSDEAQKNALKDAVEQAVGTLIDSKTMVENDEVISDKILSMSGGFVKKHTIIEGPTAKEGVVEVKIQAWVQRTQLASKLESENVVSKAVDGQSLGGEAMTRTMSRKNALEMLGEILKGYPENSLNLEVAGEPAVDESGERVIVKVLVSVNRERVDSFISRFEAYLEQAAAKKRQNARTAVEKFALNKQPGLIMKDFMMKSARDESRVSLLTRLNDKNTMALWKIYGISGEIAGVLEKHFATKPELVVDVIGSGGEIIDSKRQGVEYPFKQVFSDKAKAFYFLPFFAFEGMDAIVMPGPMTYSLSFDNLFPDEIQDIREVKLSLQSKPAAP